jgi:hypothetical protein
LPLLPYLGWVPVYGRDLQALPHLLLAGRDVGRVSMFLAGTLAAIVEPRPEAEGAELLPDLVRLLSEVEPELGQAELVLQRHQAALTALDEEQLSPGLALRAGQFKQALNHLYSGLRLLRTLPALLGAGSPQTYLILMQNSDELRPTGGYITAAGHLVFEQGRITEFVMQDSYAVDHLSEAYPYPPRPLYEYMAADYWVLRDASWSPDFPAAARTAIYLYELGQGLPANGVIALNQQALPYLLRALKPLQVEGERVTPDNVIELMRQHWAPEIGQNQDRSWWSQRKSFMLALAETIEQKFEQETREIDLPVLMAALAQALSEKHILVYLDQSAWNEFLVEKNWAGALQPVQSDYLMVAEANVGFNKASALVERRLSYQVSLAGDGSAEAQARLTYRHPAPKHEARCSRELRYDPIYRQNMERCYWNYLRLIVPAGALLSSGPGVVVEGQYLLRGQATTGTIDTESLGADKKSWGQLLLLAPQETMSLDYSYTLPPGTARLVENHQAYTLYLQKQPGAGAMEAEVVVTLPEEGQFLSSQPLPESRQGRVITYRLSLTTDREIDLYYSMP